MPIHRPEQPAAACVHAAQDACGHCLPLRQFVHADATADPGFPTQDLLDRLSRPGRFMLRRYGAGCLVLAADAGALEDAREMLTCAFGPLLAFGSVHLEPESRTGEGPAAASRIRTLVARIGAPRDDALPLLRMLLARAADVREIELLPGSCTIRFEGPLAQLHGIDAALREVSGEAARVLHWEVRDAPEADGARR